jgi:hypothetical protein
VLAYPTPSRKRPTNQPGTRAGHRPAVLIHGRLHTWPTSLAPSLAPGGLVACHGVHRPPGPRAGQTARPGTRRQACGSSSRTGWSWAAAWRAASTTSTQEPPTPPGSQGRAAVGDGVNDQGDAQQPGAVASSTSDATTGRRSRESSMASRRGPHPVTSRLGRSRCLRTSRQGMQISTVNRPSISLKGPVAVPQKEQCGPTPHPRCSNVRSRNDSSCRAPRRRGPNAASNRPPAADSRSWSSSAASTSTAYERGEPRSAGSSTEPVLRLILAQLW